MTCATADTEIIAKAIHLACRAPSLHNSQPWRWIVGEAAVDLFADHERVVRSADRTGARRSSAAARPSIISGSRSPPLDGKPTSTPFPTRVTATISLRSTSPPLITSPPPSVTAPTRY